MEKIYFLCFAIIVLVFGMAKAIQNLLEKQIKNSEIVSLHDLIQVTKNQLMKESINDIRISIGRFYAYDVTKNLLLIKHKRVYNSLDKFVLFHEIGHICDERKKYFKICRVVANSKVIILGLWIPIIVTNLWLMITTGVFVIIHIIIYTLTSLYVIICICVTIVNSILETSASTYALSKIQLEEDECIFRWSAKLAIVDQTCFWLMIEMPIVFLLMHSV